jgi:hypothetical protein
VCHSLLSLLLDVRTCDITYNLRRNILGTLSVGEDIAYHLFMIDTDAAKNDETVKLIRKSRWLPQYSNQDGSLLF